MAMTYETLYKTYPDYVVLMTRKFMYEAKHNCARVLSYLMGYKLTQDKEGTILCAGPDKDKIVAVLKAHHVNYLISEIGKITEESEYTDNGFKKYLALGQKIPVEPMPPVTRTDYGPGKAMVSPTPEKEKPVPEWLQDGLAVQHKTFGVGIVEAVVDKKIRVNFPDVGQKTFVWPEAFDKQFLVRT